LEITDNSLDLAIAGDGFFQIDLPSGETAYTRSGVFQLNENGEMVTAQGYTVNPGVTIPNDAQEIVINESGEVLVKIPNTVAFQNVGQIQLATFINPAGLIATGDTLFLESPASGTPVTGNPSSSNFGNVRQGMVENSNVDVVEEMTNLITAQRAYEMNSKIITTSDEMLQTVTQLR
jgi:flagellar basal-body rod protein FlgG